MTDDIQIVADHACKTLFDRRIKEEGQDEYLRLLLSPERTRCEIGDTNGELCGKPRYALFEKNGWTIVVCKTCHAILMERL
jgi:hypothetical protein